MHDLIFKGSKTYDSKKPDDSTDDKKNIGKCIAIRCWEWNAYAIKKHSDTIVTSTDDIANTRTSIHAILLEFNL